MCSSVGYRGATGYLLLSWRAPGLRITVRAEQAKRLAAWLVICYVNGGLFDGRMSEDVFETARGMMAEAAIEHAERVLPGGSVKGDMVLQHERA